MASAPQRHTLLVIDDDEAGCRLVRAIFKSEPLDVVEAHNGEAGFRLAAACHPDIVLLDVRLPVLDGLQVLERLKTTAPAVPVVMLTASRDVRTAVRATQLGAFDYLTKPIDREELRAVVRRGLETRSLRLEVEELRRDVRATVSDSLTAQMGPGSLIRHVVEQVETVAASNFTVLILGETGTGKELVAQAIHKQSARSRKPFVALDCGAIPETLLESELFGHERGAFTGADRRKQGQFQLAEKGSCFLDEVGNLPQLPQAKLLRVLESREVQPVGSEKVSPVDVRFIAATNRDLQLRVDEGMFRADLYFRLAQYTIRLPPLRDRIDDLAHLVQRFVDEASVELRRPVQEVAADALGLLQQHNWPGNVRELRNVIRQAVLQSKSFVIGSAAVRAALGAPGESLPATRGAAGRPLRQIAEEAAHEAERDAICDALRTAKGNKSRAARALKTDYKTLHVKLKSLGIRAHEFHE